MSILNEYFSFKKKQAKKQNFKNLYQVSVKQKNAVTYRY